MVNSNLLFIFEIANNHQGSVEHCTNIIQTYAEIAKRYKINAAVKFQYRDLDTFIHPHHQDRDIKFIKRFKSTRLSKDEFKDLAQCAKSCGLGVISTPFDEASVSTCVDNELDAIKIASCSAMDWPLLEEVCQKTDKDIILSTGGLDIPQIDEVVSFLQKRNTTFALMHCVALYPTPFNKLNLNFIDKMKLRFNLPIGYSGHESPESNDVGKLAIAKGATILERHIGIGELNAYSMNPEQTERWIEGVLQAKEMCHLNVCKTSESEATSLMSLQRGVYAKDIITIGNIISKDDVFFAMPLQGQLTSGKFTEAEFEATRTYDENDWIDEPPYKEEASLQRIKNDVLHLLREIKFEPKGKIELSHHRGLLKFRQCGAAIVNVINEKEYCKKIIVVLPGQRHPQHYHKVKKETFSVLHGDGVITLGDVSHNVSVGDILHVHPGVMHNFESEHHNLLPFCF